MKNQMAYKKVFLLIFTLFILSSFYVSAEMYYPSEQRYIDTGQNTDWLYTSINRADGTKNLVGISKIDRGSIGFADDEEFYGSMWLVPAYRIAGNYYLCPIVDMQTVNEVRDLNNGWYFDLSDSAVDCYQYGSLSTSSTADLDVQISFITNSDGQTKININSTLNGLTAENTGFAFIFFPENPVKYRYVKLDGVNYDLAGANGMLPIDKTFEFLDSSQTPIGDVFDWTDMLDTGSRFMEILTIGGQKALMVGTYNLGQSNTIQIDPLYQVDYSPNPAEHLQGGLVYDYDDSEFSTVTDITTEMSDDLLVTSFNVDEQGTNGNAIAGAWSKTYDSEYQYFLRIYMTSGGASGVPTIYAYNTTDTLSPNFQNYGAIAGAGWKNFNVTSQVQYMTETLGLNYTKLRFYTANDGEFSELRLRAETNDTENPSINDCWIEESPIYCNGQATYYCNVTDNLDVQNVTFKINGVNYTAIQNDDIWYYTINFDDALSPITENVTLTDVYATDILGLTNSSVFNLNILHDCKRIRLVYPQPLTVVDEGDSLPLVLDILKFNLDTYYGNFTCPNGTVRQLLEENFTNGLTSDNFDTDTEDIKWVHAEDKEVGQVCDTDIDGTVPNKMSFVVDGNGISSTVQCGYNSIPLADGNFDAQLEFNFSLIEQDTYLTFRSAPTDTLSAFGVRAFISVGKNALGNYYTFGWNNGTGTVTQTIPTTDTYGKLRIKRTNMDYDDNETPTFNLYFWNYTTNDWQDFVGDIILEDSARLQYIQIKPVSEGSNYGRLELEVDNFQIQTDNYTFAYFPSIMIYGVINITVFANWTTPATEIIYTSVNVTNINDAPSRPFIEAPEVSEVVDYGYYIISWGKVFDEENDAVKFNISLLNDDYSFNRSIVSNYGNISITSYNWTVDSSYAETNYSMEIKVFETDSVEKLSNTETLAGLFQIFNVTCVENWTVDSIVCEINDTYLKSYTDTNACGTYNDLPVDNGTYVYCNYCSEDLEIYYVSDCYPNGTREFGYIDNNYYSCCAITGLITDCSVDYNPYNVTGITNCSYFNNTMNCDTNTFSEYGFLNDKIKWLCNIPDNNKTANCISFVKDNESGIVQTNPDYKTKSNSVFSIGTSETEERTSFVTENGLVNVYFTKDNLLFDGRQYIFGVRCSTDTNTYEYKELFIPEYENVNDPINRWFWIKGNVIGIFFWLILAGIILFFVLYTIKKLRNAR